MTETQSLADHLEAALKRHMDAEPQDLAAAHQQVMSILAGHRQPILEALKRPVPVVSLKTMQLSDDRADYFVSIRVGDREVTPHVFCEEYKAAYHVALYDWLLNGVGEEPDVVEFGPDDWPAQSTDVPRVDDDFGVVVEKCAEIAGQYSCVASQNILRAFGRRNLKEG